jgi:hypothetical protein
MRDDKGENLVKTLGLILFIAHVVGCNSMIIGYMVGATNSDSGGIIRQLKGSER